MRTFSAWILVASLAGLLVHGQENQRSPTGPVVLDRLCTNGNGTSSKNPQQHRIKPCWLLFLINNFSGLDSCSLEHDNGFSSVGSKNGSFCSQFPGKLESLYASEVKNSSAPRPQYLKLFDVYDRTSFGSSVDSPKIPEYF
jgi:hypothetical protein